MKSKLLKGVTGLLLCSLVACGPGERRKEETVSKSLFPLEWESPEKEIEGGTFKIGVVSSTAFKGLFNPILWQDAIDGEFFAPIDAPLFISDGDFNLVDGGLASLKVDVENKVINVKLKEGLKWDDGEPLTIDDYIFTYEVLGNKDYTGVRYDEGTELIVGMKEYHEGKAKTIKGIEKVNDLEVNIHVKEVQPAITAGGGGLLTSIMPKHYLQDVEISKLESSDKVRLHPVGAGEFKVKQIIPGESVEYEPNPYYYNEKAKPKVDKLIVKILPDSSVISSMKNGEYHIYKNVLEDIYSEYKDFEHLAVLGRQALYYQYIGFNLGHWDANKGENITDKDSKLYDINLRKAIGYAMNVEQVCKTTYKGLRERATGIVPPVFHKYYSGPSELKYDPEKAKELLDKAGYKDVDGDGIREDKDGKPFEIFFAFPAMGDISEPLASQYIQDWKAVGLNVSLTTGRIMEGNSFFDKVRANDKEIDMWIAAWGVGTNFDLNGLYGPKSAFNFSRLRSEKNDELMTKVADVRGISDHDYRAAAVKEWEHNYLENELGFLPITFRYELRPISKNIKFSSFTFDTTSVIDKPTSLVK